MHPKNKSVPTSAVSIPAADPVSCEPVEILTEKDGAERPPIDFTSPEFNVRDDLDDNIGNYKHFQKLDNIVTSDMLHQEQRKHKKSPPGKNDTARLDDKKTKSSDNDQEINRFDLSPVTITSRGRILIIDTDPDRAAGCGKFLQEQGLTCTVLLAAKDDAHIPLPGKPPFLQADSIVVRGGFGGFTALATGTGFEAEPRRLPDNKNSSFDLILDLQPIPSFSGQMLPLGYYAPGDDVELLHEVLTELPDMRGVFTKPRFTIFQPENCLYGRSRTRTCQHCLQACPVGAVRIEKGVIFIDPYLCQGCGSCALVCPANAIQTANPTGNELLTGIRDLLADHRAETDSAAPVLMIHGQETPPEELYAMQSSLADIQPLFFAVEEIGRIGAEIMLSALAYGAAAIIMVCGRNIAAETLQALEQQRRIGSRILQGLNMPEDRIRLLALPTGTNGAESMASGIPLAEILSKGLPTPVAGFSPDNEKRSLIRQAVNHLAEFSPAPPVEISLPEGAPFGCVVMDKAVCTLCMACVSACPTGALAADGDLPRLYFNENDCHQCGLCLDACPEAALQLRPRLLCSGNDHVSPAVLQETEPFSCIECGTPFTSQAMINRLQNKLAGHWMYRSDRQLRRLRMCRTCSTRDALLAKDFQS